MEQQLITGRPASDGVVMGKALVTTDHDDFISRKHVENDTRYTLEDFNRAVEQVRAQTLEFQQFIEIRITEPVSQIFEAHLEILEDPAFVGKMQRRIETGTHALDAIKEVTVECIGFFLQSTNSSVREKVDDLKDLASRLFVNLANSVEDTGCNGRIVITSKLFPSDILRLVAQRAKGIILTSGGVSAHISVLARSLEIPMVLVDAPLLADVAIGTTILMDAHSGAIYVNPDPLVISGYGNLLEVRAASAVEDNRPLETYTCDGRRIHLRAAVGLISEAKLARELHAEGIGLYRSEMPFLIRSNFPSEDEQYSVYRNVIREMEEGEIVFRTLDIGGDKTLRYFSAAAESNPFLGLRGTRFTLHHHEILCVQVRALLRAGHDRPLKIMFPLISSVDSFLHARNLVADMVKSLQSENVPHQSNPQVGAMVELPSAVALADELAAEADFLSIGTNDLVQYMLAVDRNNSQVADWYVPWHPAIIRAIKTIVEAAQQHDKPVSVCGEMASNSTLIPVLIGMGITALTIPPRQIPKVQQCIQSLNAAESDELAERVLRTATVAEISRILQIPRVFPGY